MREIDPITALALVACIAACPGPQADTSTSASSASETSTTAATATGLTVGNTSTAVMSSTTAPTTGTPMGCPNGVIEDDEVCDDGNMVDGDGCNNDCTESGALLKEYKSGYPNADSVRDVAIDDEGGIIVVGVQQVGDGTDRWLGRFNEALEPTWTKAYDLAPSEYALSVVVAPGAIFATGATIPTLDPNPSTQVRSLWTARLTLTGEIVWEDVWANELGNDTLGDVYANQIALGEGGDLFVAGIMSVSTETLGAFARRYTADGVEVWTGAHPINHNNNDLFPLGPGLAVLPEAVYVGWRIWGVVGETLMAFSPGSGASLWALQTSDAPGVIHSIARALNDDLVIAGVGNDFAELTVRRTTSTGEPLWSSGNCSGRTARAVAVDLNGDILVIGDGPGAIDANIRLCKFSPEGTLRWGRDIEGGVGDDRGYTVAITPSNRIVAGGSVTVGPGQIDAWLAVYSP